MIFISHRGNLERRIKEEENKPEKILECIKLGYQVEIDVWFKNNRFFLGHDEPQFIVDDVFLKHENLWCHAKNLNSLQKMLEYDIHCFWHQNDSYTITSKQIIWCYPNSPLLSNCVAVLPEFANYSLNDLKQCYAICTDEVLKYKNLLE